jgi:predicted nucleic acid-binding protein
VAVIFDTNALSAFADGDDKLLRALGNETELALPATVLGEYLYGIQQSRLRTSYQAWLHANLPFFDLLPIVRETAERYSEIRRELKAAGSPIPTNDLWIAAVARHHRMPLITRDARFRAIHGLRILHW